MTDALAQTIGNTSFVSQPSTVLLSRTLLQNPGTILTYSHILLYTTYNKDEPLWCCRKSLSFIASLVGTPTRTLRRHTKILQDVGLIKITDRKTYVFNPQELTDAHFFLLWVMPHHTKTQSIMSFMLEARHIPDEVITSFMKQQIPWKNCDSEASKSFKKSAENTVKTQWNQMLQKRQKATKIEANHGATHGTINPTYGATHGTMMVPPMAP